MPAQYGTTFGKKVDDFDTAMKLHPVVKIIADKFVRGNPDRFAIMKELWDGLTDQLKNEDKNAIADMVDLTTPPTFIPLMRRSDSIFAAYAFACIGLEIERLTEKDCTNDLILRPHFEQAWRMFHKRLLEANTVEEGFGCGDGPSWHTLRDIDNTPDAGDWKDRTMEIAKLAGKMFDSFNYIAKRVRSDDPMEVESVKTGKELERLLPEELALMTVPDTEDMQTMKVIKGEALQRKMKGTKTQSRGPIVMLIDESGSMFESRDYHTRRYKRGRNTWAKACAVALARVAWHENREVIAVHFGNGSVTQLLPKDDTKALFEMARSFMSGGTSFGGALHAGRACVKDLESRGFKGADIVLISDGDEPNWASHNAILDELDKEGVDLWTIAIGLSFAVDAPTRKRAKKYVEAKDSMLGNDATATALVDGLQDAAKNNEGV